MTTKVLLFELNEVPWRIIEDYVVDHPTSELARLLPKMQTFETTAEDTALSPWITWPSLHRGIGDDSHTISDFGQDLSEINEAYPAVWELLAKAGVPVGVFGSLHSYPVPSNVEKYAFFVPDVFASGSECFPKRIESFQDFNLSMSRESARNVSTKLPITKAIKFLSQAPGLGLKARTALDVGLQLLDERRRSWVKTRRRTYQVLLAFDIYMKELERTEPAFSTFFTNHIASTMHRYWGARYPGDYKSSSFESEWTRTYSREISWTMSSFDKMLKRLARFVEARPEYELWIASSMGQAATEASQVLTQLYLQDTGTFMQALGFSPDDWQTRPAMLPRIIFEMKNGKGDEFAERLARVEIADRGPLPWKRITSDIFRIHPGILQNLEGGFCTLDGRRRELSELGFANVQIQDSVGQTAYHIPAGTLLRYGAALKPTKSRTAVSTLSVAPSILSRFGVAPPDYMRGDAF